MERIVNKGDDFVVDTLVYFKPVQRFEYRGNWVLESERDKEEDWLVVAALGDVLEKVLID